MHGYTCISDTYHLPSSMHTQLLRTDEWNVRGARHTFCCKVSLHAWICSLVHTFNALARPTVVELDRLIIGRRYTKFTTIIIIDARDEALWLINLFDRICGLERRDTLRPQRQWRLWRRCWHCSSVTHNALHCGKASGVEKNNLKSARDKFSFSSARADSVGRLLFI